MSVKMSASYPVQSLNMQPGMLSGPEALRALILMSVVLTLSVDSERETDVVFFASKGAKNLFSSFSREVSQVCGGGV